MADLRAARWRPVGTSIFADITRRAVEADAVNLGQGFPAEDGPGFVKDAAVRALREAPNQYAPPGGVPGLTAAIAEWEAPVLLRRPDPASEITVTTGCTGALAAVMLGLLNPGDEVVLFEPFYDGYRACVLMAGAVPVCVTLAPDPVSGRFTFDPAALAEAVSPRTRAIIVNTPHNPTGKVFDEAELAQIADVCRRYDLIAVSDEVYSRLVFSGVHRSIAALPGMADRTVVCGSFGKTFSLTGWKIGWTIAPPDITQAVRAANQFLVFAVTTPLQRAAADALASPLAPGWTRTLREQLRASRDRLADALADAGFLPLPADSGYFIMADHRPVSAPRGLRTDVDVCHALIAQAGVAAIPPSAFYATPGGGRDHLRFAFCKPIDVIDAAAARLRAWAGR